MSNSPLGRKLIGAILISGRGSNMCSLLAAAKDVNYPIRFTTVISNNAQAAGLELARQQNCTALYVAKGNEEAIHRHLIDAGINIVCLAGYMKILSPEFIRQWYGRILNIHPSLLPRHKGLQPQRQAILAGDRTSGATVHVVTAEVDSGHVLAQTTVAVLDGDSVETLSERILKVEHQLYPAAAADFAQKLMVSA